MALFSPAMNRMHLEVPGEGVQDGPREAQRCLFNYGEKGTCVWFLQHTVQTLEIYILLNQLVMIQRQR